MSEDANDSDFLAEWPGRVNLTAQVLHGFISEMKMPPNRELYERVLASFVRLHNFV